MARLRSGRKTDEGKEFNEAEDDGNGSLKSKTLNPTKSLSCTHLIIKIATNTLAVLVCIYLASPIISLLFPGAVTQVIFLNLFGKRFFTNDLSYPESPAINCTGTRNFYLDSTDGVKLGTWQVLPHSLRDKSKTRDADFYEKSLSDGKPVIIYFHGNAGTRGWGHRVTLYQMFSEYDYHVVAVDYREHHQVVIECHRVAMYKELAQLDYHVLAVDYRGYADSTGWPSIQGVFDDAESAYHWAKQASKEAPVFLYGHSLGSEVASRVAKRLCDAENCPAGVVLETPFNNLYDAFMHHPFGIPFWVMPGYLWLHAYAMNDTISAFHSDHCMASITCPILILHAEDDAIVPFHLGHKLYKVAKEVRPESAGPVKFVNFGRNGYGHKHICDSPDLPPVIKEFIG